jgi:hypothetical protein
MNEYGIPGGLWLAYFLDMAAENMAYIVVNEGGEEVAAFSFETDAQAYCQENTKQ